jgi:hypothetical protein
MRNMSDEVKAGAVKEPAWKTDPLFAHMNLTEEGIARAKERRLALDERREEAWRELRERLGIER